MASRVFSPPGHILLASGNGAKSTREAQEPTILKQMSTDVCAYDYGQRVTLLKEIGKSKIQDTRYLLNIYYNDAKAKSDGWQNDGSDSGLAPKSYVHSWNQLRSWGKGSSCPSLGHASLKIG